MYYQNQRTQGGEVSGGNRDTDPCLLPAVQAIFPPLTVLAGKRNPLLADSFFSQPETPGNDPSVGQRSTGCCFSGSGSPGRVTLPDEGLCLWCIFIYREALNPERYHPDSQAFPVGVLLRYVVIIWQGISTGLRRTVLPYLKRTSIRTGRYSEPADKSELKTEDNIPLH